MIVYPDLLIRVSEIARFKRCRRSWALGYRLDGDGFKLAPQEDQPEGSGRDVGNVFHRGMQYRYGEGRPATDAPDEKQAYLEENGLLTPEWRDDLTLARIMLQGYEAWADGTGADAREETLAVEQRLTMPLGVFHGVRVALTGKFDRLVRDTFTEELIVEDTKTVQSLDTLAQLAVDDQLLTYVAMVTFHYGQQPTRMRHNRARKVKRTGRAKPPFYDRLEMPVNDEQMVHHWDHLASTIDDMVLTLLRHVQTGAVHTTFPPTPNLFLCGWDCDFLPVCPMMDDGSDWRGALASLYVPNDPKESH